ncbi:hypothetical protein [Duganella sp. Root1480D1]|uniref:hypothetical protein n=1 Tax=Duganella sp. Root1480D1 TaxID=1736471 RepID=UPI00070BE948|nr:hypothetical protein [Duganella sp. Root1480D1]KQZ40903.1 hypothetical protein ASD58_26395 [Duganella sp. Root1480D1]
MSAAPHILRLRWFGGFSRGRVVGTVFFLGYAYLAHRVFNSDFLGVVALLMLSTAYFTGWTDVDLERAEVRRSVYFLWFLRVWRKTVPLRQGGRLCVTFRPSFRDQRHWVERDYTVIELRYGPHDWIQLAQTDRSGGDFCPAMLDRARRLAARLRIPLEERVDYMPGAIEHYDKGGRLPPQ